MSPPTPTRDRRVVTSYYQALRDRDVELLVRLLAKDFQGHLADGLPRGLGGRKDGRDAMLRAWGRVDASYDIVPEPDEVMHLDDQRAIVTGNYVGRARATGRRFDAPFVHVLDIDDARITGLRQYTDTHHWWRALADPEEPEEAVEAAGDPEQLKSADRAVLEVWSTGDVDRLDEIVAPDVVHHDPYDRYASDGLEGMKRAIVAYRRAFPDVTFTVEDQVAEGDEVVTRWRSVGTHLGSLMGETPTGKVVKLGGMVIERFEAGKIVEAWRNWDVEALVRQIAARND
jgi:uncharacterized protein